MDLVIDPMAQLGFHSIRLLERKLAGSPYMIIFQHDHTAQIMSMWIDSPNHHTVFLNGSESRCSLSSTGNCSLPSCCSSKISESTRSKYMSARRYRFDQSLMNRTHTVAIPLHLARVFKATRSPKSNCLAFPRTMATFVLLSAGTTEPSTINHSTLILVS